MFMRCPRPPLEHHTRPHSPLQALHPWVRICQCAMSHSSVSRAVVSTPPTRPRRQRVQLPESPPHKSLFLVKVGVQVDVRVDGVTDGADVMKRDGAAEAEEDPSALIAYVRACVYRRA
jgi:hypothetical protein